MSGLHDLYARLHGADAADADAAARELAASGAEVVVVSACLLGERTRYDGGDKLTPAVVDPLLADARVRVLPLCPEILGGMGCPRPPVHFDERGRAVDDRGADHTAALERGAERAVELARLAGAARGVLKERSPSCGVHLVHGPRGVQAGRGAFARRVRLPVVSESDVLEKK